MEVESKEYLALDGHMDLYKGIYNRVIKDYTHKPLSFNISTYSDVPSGLGGSSTLVVAVC